MPGQLVRYRLTGRLAARWDQSVLTLRGGPGFGKTTALAQAVRQHALDPCGVDVWYTCGPADLDPERFSDALATRIGATGGADGLESILAAISALAPLDVCLILDDVHELGARTPSADFLGRLIRRLPRTAHVVLAGRTLPEVPLARLRIAGRVTEIVESELAFTSTEVAALAADLGRDAPMTPVFGGWPALVRLALIAHPGAATEFLREELLADLSATDRRVLVALAQFGTATVDEVSRVLDRQADLVGLADRLPLIDVLNDDRVRCHELWREVLDRHPQPDAIALRRRSVRVLLDADRVYEAGGCAIAGRDWDMLESAARELVARNISVIPVDLAASWLDALPDDRQHTPEAVLLRAAVVQGTNVNDPQVDSWLDQACDGFAHRGDVTSAAAAIGLGVVAAQSRADLPRLMALTLRAAALPDACEHPILSVLMSSSQAVLAEMCGDPESAVQAFEGAPIEAVPEALSVSIYRFWMHCLLMAGRADEAVKLATRYLDTGGNAHSRRSSAIARWCAGDPSDFRDLFAALASQPAPSGMRSSDPVEPLDGSDMSLPARDCFVEQCFGALISSSGGVIDGHPAPDTETIPNARDAAVATNAAAAQAVVVGAEERAAALFRRQLARFPLDDALGECHLRRSLALGYVLEPRLRARWEAASLGPTHVRIRDLARALVDARARHPVCTEVDPQLAFCAFPLPWSVELACLLVAAGNPDGDRLARWLSDFIGAGVVEHLRRVEAQGGDPAASGATTLLRSLPIRPAKTLQIRVLGPIEMTLTDDARLDLAPRRARVRQLLVALLLHRSMSREHIIDLLWPDFEMPDAQRNLRVTLTHLRRALDPDRARGQAGYNLRIVGETVSLFDSAALQVDLWEFERLMDDADSALARSDTCRQATLLDHAVRLWRGPALDDLRSIADLEPMLQRIRLRYAEALHRLGELRLVEGRWQDAQDCAARSLAEAPFDERAHRLALAAALQRGEPTAIRAAAGKVVAALRELGVPPEPTTRILLSGARHRLGEEPGTARPPQRAVPMSAALSRK